MGKASKNLGNWGELFAASKLTNAGCQVLQMNWRSKAGEVDIVAENSDFLIFVEVKTRRTAEFGNPSDAVTPERINRIQQAAQMWPNPQSKSLRIDVFAICLEPDLAFQHFEAVSG